MPKAKKRAPKPSSDPNRSQPFVIETIFPSQEIHLIGGSSHAGKTSLLMHIINLWHRKELVFGHESHPMPFCYISAVHSLDSVKTSAKRIGLPTDKPMLSTVDVDDAANIEDVIALARSAVDGVQVIFLDGIHVFCKGSIIEYEPVATFLRNAVRRLKDTGITLIATGRCTKNRESYRASNPCDRFMGSTAWSEFTSTFIAIEPVRPDDPRDRLRRILIMPKNAAGERWDYEFSANGTLIDSASDEHNPEMVAFKLEEFNNTLFEPRGPGDQISSRDLQEIADCTEVSRRSLYRHLSNLIKEGRLEKSKWGYYRLPLKQ